jgi:hypothetical protein
VDLKNKDYEARKNTTKLFTKKMRIYIVFASRFPLKKRSTKNTHKTLAGFTLPMPSTRLPARRCKDWKPARRKKPEASRQCIGIPARNTIARLGERGLPQRSW